jgi:hypothetical protein
VVRRFPLVKTREIPQLIYPLLMMPINTNPAFMHDSVRSSPGPPLKPGQIGQYPNRIVCHLQL